MTRPFVLLPHAKKRAEGSAAMEVVLLMVFIIIPVYVVMFNMGYNGMRMRETRDALRLGAYLFMDGLTTSSSEAAKNSAEATVNFEIFPGEQNPAELSVSTTSHSPSGLGDAGRLLATVSFWRTVGVSVKRDPPYDVFGNAPIKGSIIVGTNTFTYCEVRVSDFVTGELGSLQRVASFLGGSILELFGWAPGGGPCR